MIDIANHNVSEGFIFIYRNSYNEIRSMVFNCSRLSEALEIATARGFSSKDIVAAYSIGKLAMMYRKDLKALLDRRKAGEGK